MSAFFRLLKYVHRTVVRARVRTTLTVLGTALAMGLFAFVQMVEAGVRRMDEASDQPVLVVFQASKFCPLTSLLPMRYESEIQSMEQVDTVLPTLVYINACRANLDLVTLHGVQPADLDGVHTLKVLSGDKARWKSMSDGALVGRRLAERRKLSVGDRVRLSEVDVEIAGIFESEGAGLENVAFVQIDQLQRARKQQGIATQFFVTLKPGASQGEVAAQIDQRFAVAEQPTDTKTMQAFVQGAVGEVGEVVNFARVLGYLAVLVVVLILGNTVFISAQTRRQELGVMETIGTTRATLSGLIFVESLMLSLLGGIVGVGIVAVALTLKPLTLGIEGWGIDIGPTPTVLIVGVLASLAVGLVAAIGPALHVLRRPLALAVKDT